MPNFEHKPLSFELDALEPHMSKETLEFHHGKHYKKYVDNLNELIKGTQFEDKDGLSAIIELEKMETSGPVYRNAAQVSNHEFFWNCLTPSDKSVLSETLSNEIEKVWGTVDKFKKEFEDKAEKHFGSGWCWLIKRGESLKIVDSHDAEIPTGNAVPLLVVDLWEHAYYIDHRNDRGKYLKAIWNIINWEFVEKNYTSTDK